MVRSESQGGFIPHSEGTPLPQRHEETFGHKAIL